MVTNLSHNGLRSWKCGQIELELELSWQNAHLQDITHTYLAFGHEDFVALNFALPLGGGGLPPPRPPASRWGIQKIVAQRSGP